MFICNGSKLILSLMANCSVPLRACGNHVTVLTMTSRLLLLNSFCTFKCLAQSPRLAGTGSIPLLIGVHSTLESLPHVLVGVVSAGGRTIVRLLHGENFPSFQARVSLSLRRATMRTTCKLRPNFLIAKLYY